MCDCKTVGTKEQHEQLLDIIAKTKAKTPNDHAALIQVLHEAQELYGYLPIKVQEVIAQELHIGLAEVYGVVTFYSRFSLEPKGKNQIGICTGTACFVKGANDILAEIEKELGIKAGETSADGEWSIDATRCIGVCGLAPAMTINEKMYGHVKKADVKEMLGK